MDGEIGFISNNSYKLTKFFLFHMIDFLLIITRRKKNPRLLSITVTYLWYHFLPLIAWKKLLSAFTKLVPTLHFSERIELIIMHHCLHNMVSLYLSSTSLFHGFNSSISCGARFMHPLQEAKNSTCISSDFFNYNWWGILLHPLHYPCPSKMLDIHLHPASQKVQMYIATIVAKKELLGGRCFFVFLVQLSPHN